MNERDEIYEELDSLFVDSDLVSALVEQLSLSDLKAVLSAYKRRVE